jgi:mono/diheme cytochrome c family protein
MILALAWLAAAFAEEPPDPAAGAALYARSCAACHGLDGSGSDALKAVNVRPRSFASERVMRRVSDDDLLAAISGGGPAVGRSPLMPAWGRVLSDGEMRDVVAYLRTLAAPDPMSGPVVADAEDVSAP